MRKKPLYALAVASAITAMATPAQADCGTEGGYLYIWQSCVQEEVSGRPENVCQVKEGTRDPQTVIITSNVLHDTGNNRRYPTSVFFDEAQLQLNLTINGRESSCHRSRQDAEDDLREYLADQKRFWRGKVRFVSVRMPNT
ncbi:hypothetical protein [Kordiimonas aestuarii]|uniref:hypothetical protein n=1 Tax=Kordiimonas aestuarii TaxID=1005925 RepID=UPI0021D3BC87|nr:hypothetical protein [Kordiimonas aestuarii]